MAELLSILRQEQSGDVAASSMSRQRIAYAFIALPITLLLLLQLRRAPKIATPREAMFTAMVAAIVILLCGLWQRSVLQRNRLHRNVWIMILVVIAQNLVARGFGMVMGLKMQQVFAFEMIGTAGCTTILTTIHFRSFRWLPVLPFVAALLSFTTISLRILVTIYPLMMLFLIIVWSRAARAVRQRKNEKESSASFSARSSPHV
jgi:hypothetical protein